MDIRLGDGVCFEIFDVIKVNTPIIFTTAYDEYVMKAFKVNGIDYLLKPVDAGKLSAAIDKCRSLFPKGKTANDTIKRVHHELVKDYKSRFLIKTGLHYHSVLTSDIECFYTRGEYTCLRTFAGKKYDLEYSLQQLEAVISPDHFFRINRGYIVQINSIINIVSYSTHRLRLILKNSTEEELIVSREKVAEFKKWLDK
jgi:DNA-binding LytR/AlgR family response regulator